MSYRPKPFWIMEEYEMSQPKLLSEEQKVLFLKFYENAKYNDVIPAKYAHMIHTAVAMAVGCAP
jgi:hypothetical protein